MLMLAWYDDNPKKPATKKIEEGIAAYVDRFKTHPNVVLINENEPDLFEVNGVVVRVPEPNEGRVGRNMFWIGREETRRR